MSYISYILSFILLGITNPIKDKSYTFHSVSPLKGDGVYSLLRRYNLNHSTCNIEQFYQLNDLNKDAQLKRGVKYKLPVFIFDYDGTSIRSTIGIDDWDLAVRIKKYNELLLQKGLRRATYTTSKLLWVPYHEIHCADHKTKSDESSREVVNNKTSSKSVIVDPLYGKKYEKIELLDKSLDGKVFYVISGHGGPDPGAVCKECPSTLCEDEYAYDVALRLARNLNQHGAKVEMVIQDNDGIRDGKNLKCDKDEKLLSGKKIPLSQRLRLKQRTVYVNDQFKYLKGKGIDDQYVVCIHVDSQSKNHKQDVFFYHYGQSKESKRLANNLKQKFNEKYKKYQKNRGYHGHVSERSLYVLMNTLPPAVYIELGNIKNKSDHRRLLQYENRQALANWIYEGLSDHALKKS